MNRKQFLGVAGVLLVGTVTGCGGGGGGDQNDNEIINNPGGSDSVDLSRLTVQPSHDLSAYIDEDTEFLLSWPTAADAPRTVQARVYRFLEARGGESREDLLEETSIVANSTSSWLVRPRFDLAAGGAFFLDVTTTLNRKRYAFIVEGGRAAGLPTEQDARTRGVDIINNGGTGSLSNLTVQYNGDGIGPVGISTSSVFLLRFPSEASAPAQMTVRLRRYKERRGDESPSANEQQVEFTHDAGTNVWTVRRRDNFLLERGATYILEVSALGDPRQRNYTFLTEG